MKDDTPKKLPGRLDDNRGGEDAATTHDDEEGSPTSAIRTNLDAFGIK